mgnify:CR=1 FL=1
MAICSCPGLSGLSCGRIIDCGEPDGLCDICQADKAAIAKVTVVNQEVVIASGYRSFVILHGNKVVRELTCITVEAAYHQLSPTHDERLALVVDCPRVEWDKRAAAIT